MHILKKHLFFVTVIETIIWSNQVLLLQKTQLSVSLQIVLFTHTERLFKELQIPKSYDLYTVRVVNSNRITPLTMLIKMSNIIDNIIGWSFS